MENNNPIKTIALALFPLILLAAVIYSFLWGGPTKIFQTDLPAIEEIHVLRHTLKDDLIRLDVVNSGPDPVTIAQVMVRGAFWNHDVTPKRKLNPLQRATVNIPFPWNLGEPIEIILLTSTGLPIGYEIEVATKTPTPTAAAFGRFAMLGVYVGVIPVALGICWFPFLRRLSKRGLDFFLYLTVGLLAFLTFDTLGEGLEIAHDLPDVFHGSALLALGLIGAYLILMGIDVKYRNNADAHGHGIVIAWLIAFSIGLHNLGEGLAIGSAFVLGEMGLGAMLVIGFTLHNITEGIAIVAPILEYRINIKRLIGLGLLAGVPTIFGCWIGAFTYSVIWSVLFLGIGAGALIQVIYVILSNKSFSETVRPLNLLGMFIGYLIMYGTGLIVG